MNETSLSLLDRIRDTSDSESWNRLVALYAPLLQRWLRRYGIQSSDAEDVTQEVMSILLRELPNFEHNRRPGAFRSWLRRILANRLRDYWRGAKHQPVATGTSSIDEKLNELRDENSELSQIWNSEHDRYVLKRLMRTIQRQFEPKTWEAFKRQLDGDKPETVAKNLEMSMSGVYTAKYRVLNALRRESEGLINEF